MSELEDLRKLIGTSKSIQRTKAMREQLIITEYGEPSNEIVRISQLLKSLPVPKHSIGDIVIVPPTVYGVVQFHLWEPESSEWVYGITLEEDLAKINYFPESLLVKRG